ncbi:MAG TPA: hypothetical protein VGO61_03635 [Steroidobacteraceae bacterium]|jgi:hypothetical protein|nr:hypothetical protein [Steroidobacteraceae bacterium]
MHSERVEAADSAAMPALPQPTLAARPAAKHVESGLETQDFIPRRLAAPTDEPADPVRETTRAAQGIVPRLAASLPARRTARHALPARASESDPASPVIHVTIDRIDVHQPPALAPVPRSPPAQNSRISLGDYLSAARRKP